MASAAIRTLAWLGPILVGGCVALFAAAVLPRPSEGIARMLWLPGLLVLAILAAVACDRLMRWLGPLGILLRLTLIFPDEAPSRYRAARRAHKATTSNLPISGSDMEWTTGAGDVLALILALSQHDRATRGHSERVRVFAEMLADELHLPPGQRERLRWAALLHDIGKLEVPTEILNKDGRPDEREWEILRGHPREGVRIISPLLPWLGPWAAAIEHHHERYDGAGYPDGLVGSQIPLGGRVLAVADAYEVMTSPRSYKKPLPARAARSELVRASGTHFDPAIVRAFLGISLGALWWSIGIGAVIARLPLVGALVRRVLPRTSRTTVVIAGAAGLVLTLSLAGILDRLG